VSGHNKAKKKGREENGFVHYTKDMLICVTVCIYPAFIYFERYNGIYENFARIRVNIGIHRILCTVFWYQA